MLRASEKRRHLPSPQFRSGAKASGWLGAPGIGAAMDGELDWSRIAPPVTDYTVWVDASDPNGLNNPVAGGSVGVIFNRKRGVGGHFAAAAADAPTWGSRRIGPYLALDFTSQYFLSGLAAQMAVRPVSVMMVLVCDSFGGTARHLVSSNHSDGWGMYLDTSGVISHLNNNVAGVGSGFTITTGTAHVVGEALSASQINFFYDGSFSPVANSTSRTAGTLVWGTYGITAAGNYFDGAYGELFVWPRELSNDEMTAMYRYLKTKWRTA